MSGKRPTLGSMIKDVALKLAREAERAVGAQDDTPCASCGHARSEHCGCGTVCLAEGVVKGVHDCKCPGFSPKAPE